MTEVHKLHHDGVGQLAYWPEHSMVGYLTPCCEATAKGSGDGVVCRKCYQPVDERLGGAWDAEVFAFTTECECPAGAGKYQPSSLTDCPKSPLYGLGWR
ncbi:hypothetical protein KAMIYU_9 [Mycobacterium phage Kamiyu]|uniref:Uncharacterized protein n=1 Tax=Mycobacterium phage Bernardo TaxID=1429903 RepID=V5R8U4_9CAUD|nr:hypothetical protein PHAEDRUS_8 [Mycobacterium phage Phaedrus]YP_002564107.1 gp9 [Mycobacterium phage Phlyer]YP_008858935.1 hypothetical protein X818_gp009 [Mycobacterium phage Bernardo]AER50140.1 hypothetical protein KAMIYU_9 [Mycobacterium phage Kamiyu]AHN84226.1 hypothetical protein HEATHCLIFF_9 [Mycobacterium phage Heathcliff]AKG94808.1 hypothetical protein SEA_COROFIN_9 [Mycobacterium phage Corofin]AVR55930.1 hypothetical protein SEA_YAHALOM_9 [Mycobacterium phage Yahalom]AXH47993.1 